MGCGASAGAKYEGEAPAVAGKVGQEDASGAKAEPAKAEPEKAAATATEPPPEKPPEEAEPVQEPPAEAKLAPPAEEKSEPPAEAKPEAAEEAPAEAKPEAAEEIPAEDPEPPAVSEPPQSLAAEAVVAEAEAALAEARPEPVDMDEVAAEVERKRCNTDPELHTNYNRMGVASALVELDRSAGARLGICVRGAESVLLITKVEEEGLIPAWNKTNLERAVRPGNCIIQVNGLCGIAEELLDELQTAVSLRVEVDRTDKDVRAALTSEGMAHWCREQIETIYQKHDEAGLKTLDRRMNTYKDRELALYRTLSKKFGEEPKDPEQCANAIEDTAL